MPKSVTQCLCLVKKINDHSLVCACVCVACVTASFFVYYKATHTHTIQTFTKNYLDNAYQQIVSFSLQQIVVLK